MFPSCEIPSVQESDLNLSLMIRVLSPGQDKMWPELTTVAVTLRLYPSFRLTSHDAAARLLQPDAH